MASAGLTLLTQTGNRRLVASLTQPEEPMDINQVSLGAAGHYSAHGGAVVLNAQDHFFRPALFN